MLVYFDSKPNRYSSLWRWIVWIVLYIFTGRRENRALEKFLFLLDGIEIVQKGGLDMCQPAPSRL